jgi:hypothetical protein
MVFYRSTNVTNITGGVMVNQLARCLAPNVLAARKVHAALHSINTIMSLYLKQTKRLNPLSSICFEDLDFSGTSPCPSNFTSLPRDFKLLIKPGSELGGESLQAAALTLFGGFTCPQRFIEDVLGSSRGSETHGSGQSFVVLNRQMWMASADHIVSMRYKSRWPDRISCMRAAEEYGQGCLLREGDQVCSSELALLRPLDRRSFRSYLNALITALTVGVVTVST